MNKHICKFCKKEFNPIVSQRKFCDQTCHDLYYKKIHTVDRIITLDSNKIDIKIDDNIKLDKKIKYLKKEGLI